MHEGEKEKSCTYLHEMRAACYVTTHMCATDIRAHVSHVGVRTNYFTHLNGNHVVGVIFYLVLLLFYLTILCSTAGLEQKILR